MFNFLTALLDGCTQGELTAIGLLISLSAFAVMAGIGLYRDVEEAETYLYSHYDEDDHESD